jgi:hypothetical protein
VLTDALSGRAARTSEDRGYGFTAELDELLSRVDGLVINTSTSGQAFTLRLALAAKVPTYARSPAVRRSGRTCGGCCRRTARSWRHSATFVEGGSDALHRGRRAGGSPRRRGVRAVAPVRLPEALGEIGGAVLEGGRVSNLPKPPVAYAAWGKALGLPALPGLVVGRTLLFAPDGDVAAAVDIAVDLVNGGNP